VAVFGRGAGGRRGNTANASFVVTVLGAQEQLAQLVQEVVDATSLPPRPRRN
jgi:hypothetical protein